MCFKYIHCTCESFAFIRSYAQFVRETDIAVRVKIRNITMNIREKILVVVIVRSARDCRIS